MMKKYSNKRLLYFGPSTYGGTCLQRYKALSELFKESYIIDSRRIYPDKKSGRSFFKSLQGRIGIGPIFTLSRKILLQECFRFKPDLIWIDNGFIIDSKTLMIIRKNFDCKIVHYTPDSVLAPGMSSICLKKSIQFYDYTITTKEQDLDYYKKYGAKNILNSLQGYDPVIHRITELNKVDKQKFSCDVSFIGQYMNDRALDLSYLKSSLDIDLKIYGFDWEKKLKHTNLKKLLMGPAIGTDYAKAIQSSKISLGFLNRKVRDTFTTRTFEIPACGGFLLAERSAMHSKLFSEDKEAVFFSNKEELVEKVKYYLKNDEKRNQICVKGNNKINSSNYSWPKLMKNLLDKIN